MKTIDIFGLFAKNTFFLAESLFSTIIPRGMLKWEALPVIGEEPQNSQSAPKGRESVKKEKPKRRPKNDVSPPPSQRHLVDHRWKVRPPTRNFGRAKRGNVQQDQPASG